MFSRKRRKPSTSDRPASARGAAKRLRDNARMRQQSINVREIGPLPQVADPIRRASTKFDLGRFLKTYCPKIFYLLFSPDHIEAIKKLERAILTGGLFAFAMPRGSGKTVITLGAAMWAILHGHIPFVALIGATATKARDLLETIKALLRTNALLAADFPEACVPFRALEDDGRRASGQIVNGLKTYITWGKDKLVFPTIPDSPSSAAVITVAGITSAIRGQNHTMPDGRIVRPKLVIPDDPQTKTSAWSDSQCEKRIGILNGDILGMAGPGEQISVAMPCTVIRENDMADQMLDPKRNPQWQGTRAKMMYSFPIDEKKWEEYAQLRDDSFRRGGKGEEATAMYKENREAMDAGARVGWPERFDPDEISATQNAMNLKFRDEEAFHAEYQNAPQKAKTTTVLLTAADIITKLSGFARGVVPLQCQKVTSFIDVQDDLLFWMICAWTVEDFAGYVIDYGTFPEQPRRYFQLRQASPTLASAFPGLPIEDVIRRGLETLVPDLLSRKMPRGETVVTIDRLLIDQGYKPDTVHRFIQGSTHKTIITPAKGVGIGAGGRPISEYVRKTGELYGTHWMIPIPAGRELRHIKHDTNSWKTFIHERLALNDKGALRLYGNKSGEHRLLADHFTAEIPIPTEGQGRRLNEWKIKPSRPDNHFFDDAIGCAVAASYCGCGKAPAPPAAPPRRRMANRFTYL